MAGKHEAVLTVLDCKVFGGGFYDPLQINVQQQSLL